MHFEWTFTAGQIANVIALLAIVVGLWRSRVKTAEKAEAMHGDNKRIQQAMLHKVDTMYGWFERNIINGGGWDGG